MNVSFETILWMFPKSEIFHLKSLTLFSDLNIPNYKSYISIKSAFVLYWAQDFSDFVSLSLLKTLFITYCVWTRLQVSTRLEQCIFLEKHEDDLKQKQEIISSELSRTSKGFI